MLQIKIISLGILLGFLGTAQAQQNLASLVNEAGVEWMIGQWEAQAEDGDTIQQGFAWDLNKHVITTLAKSSRIQAKGMIAIDPASGEARYIAFSDTGAAFQGVWSRENGTPVLRVKVQDLQGRTWKSALLYKRVDDNTMQNEFYEVDDAGSLVEPARRTLTFKRKK